MALSRNIMESLSGRALREEVHCWKWALKVHSFTSLPTHSPLQWCSWMKRWTPSFLLWLLVAMPSSSTIIDLFQINSFSLNCSSHVFLYPNKTGITNRDGNSRHRMEVHREERILKHLGKIRLIWMKNLENSAGLFAMNTPCCSNQELTLTKT